MDSHSKKKNHVDAEIHPIIQIFGQYWSQLEAEDSMHAQGCHGQGKSSGKWKNFQVREKSGNYIFSQGNLKKNEKVMEKSGNFKMFLKRC